MTEPIVIFVYGGCVQHVHPPELEYHLVDYDSIENGYCPLCFATELPRDRDACPSCGIDWSLCLPPIAIAEKIKEIKQLEEADDERQI